MPFDFTRHRADSIERYRAVRPLYEHFAESLRAVLRASIPASCPIHSIEARAKGLDQFGDKASKPADDDASVPKYPEPMRQITDLAGIRIITFFPRNLEDVGRSIDAEFDVVERRDKGEELVAEGRFGYQSIHYLVKLRETRTTLAEYRRFEGLIGEIQARTILQHAWAEMEHDIQYKSVAAIPALIRRRFMSLAGMLEIADREFQTIQDADAALREDVRLALDVDLSTIEELKVDKVPLEEQLETLDAAAQPEERAYVRGNARALLVSGYYTDAVRAYDQVIAVHPNVHTNYLGRARAKFLAGDTPGALGDLASAAAIFPDDPQIPRLREQIEEGASLSAVERNTAQAKVFEGNKLLASGRAEEALQRYTEAEAIGWHANYSHYNKAMASCMAADFGKMRECLAQYRSRRNTFFGVGLAAVLVLAALLAEEAYEPLLADLREQLAVVNGYSFARSPLRFFEEGVMKRNPDVSDRLKVVFLELRSPNDELPAATA